MSPRRSAGRSGTAGEICLRSGRPPSLPQLVEPAPEPILLLADEVIAQIKLGLEGLLFLLRERDLLLQDFDFARMQPVEPIEVALKGAAPPLEGKGHQQLDNRDDEQQNDRPPAT